MKKYCDGPIFLRAVKATVKVTQVPYLIVSGVWRDYSPGAQLSVEIRIVRCQMSTLKLTLIYKKDQMSGHPAWRCSRTSLVSIAAAQDTEADTGN